MNKVLKRVMLTIITSSIALMNLIVPTKAYAAVDPSCSSSFLGIPAWYAYLEVVPANTLSNRATKAEGCVILDGPGGKPIEGIEDLASVLPLVIIAILDALLRIAGLVAFFFVVLSGFKFVFAQGNPEKEKAARSSLFNAVIGLMISIVAAFVVGFLGKRLGG